MLSSALLRFFWKSTRFDVYLGAYVRPWRPWTSPVTWNMGSKMADPCHPSNPSIDVEPVLYSMLNSHLWSFYHLWMLIAVNMNPELKSESTHKLLVVPHQVLHEHWGQLLISHNSCNIFVSPGYLDVRPENAQKICPLWRQPGGVRGQGKTYVSDYLMGIASGATELSGLLLRSSYEYCFSCHRSSRPMLICVDATHRLADLEKRYAAVRRHLDEFQYSEGKATQLHSEDFELLVKTAYKWDLRWWPIGYITFVARLQTPPENPDTWEKNAQILTFAPGHAHK